FLTNARFRLIMAPSLLWLAAVGWDRTPPALRSWRTERGRVLAAAGGCALGVIAAWGDFYDVRAYYVPQISVNTGVMEHETGQLDAAASPLRARPPGYPHHTLPPTPPLLPLHPPPPRRRP